MAEAISKPALIAMMGLPRSGKSTIVHQMSGYLGCPIVRRDAVRLALHGQRYQAEAEGMVKAITDYMLKALFIAGHQVVICDETNYSRVARDRCKDPMWETYFLVVDTPPEVCKERAIATGQPDLIPVIDDMWARYVPLGPDEKQWPRDYLLDLGVVNKVQEALQILPSSGS